MPKHTLDYDLDAVFPFIKRILPGLSRSEDMRVIGLRRDDELVAGVAYEGFNGRNIWMHVAALPGARWMTRMYLRVCFVYPFLVCKVDRLSGYVNDNNTLARRFDEHLGFQEETRLSGAAPDGGDVIIYVMRRQDCRFLG
jgi:RimJ/RimL family protein N-acetyltransferase